MCERVRESESVLREYVRYSLVKFFPKYSMMSFIRCVCVREMGQRKRGIDSCMFQSLTPYVLQSVCMCVHMCMCECVNPLRYGLKAI